MEIPTIQATRAVAPDVDALTLHLPVPGLGLIPVNSFLIRSAEPVLVDTGIVAFGDAWFGTLRDLIDPEQLRWIWLTHADPDHTGCLDHVLAAAPKAQVVTTFLGMAKLGLRAPVPPERIRLLNPGQVLEAGDRRLRCLKPPSYDAPETTSLFDESTRTYVSADSFGAVLDRPYGRAEEMPPSALREGMVAWGGIDAPWLTRAAPETVDGDLERILALAPDAVLSSHLPPSRGMVEDLSRNLRAVVGSTSVPMPDQDAFQRMLVAS